MLRTSLVTTTFSLILAALVGCGGGDDGLHQISGQVSVEGTPIDQGSITFLSADGGTPSAGGVIREGAYQANVPPGEKIVLVLGSKVVGQTPIMTGVPDSGMRDALETVTHRIYNAKHLTPLRAEVSGDNASLNFELTKDGKGG